MNRHLLKIGAAMALLLTGGSVFALRQAGAAIQPAAPAPALTAAAQVSDVIDRMANSMDQFGSLQAAFTAHQYGPTTQTTQANFVVQLGSAPGARTEVTQPDGSQQRYTYSESRLLVHNVSAGTYRVQRIAPTGPGPTLPTAQRRSVDQAGHPVVMYRPAPVMLGTQLAEAIFPQQTALGILARSAVTLTGQETVLGRTTLTLTAVPPDDMQKLLAADTLKLWVDTETGILLREESWQAGRLTSDQVATQFSLNPQVPLGIFRITVPAGARELSPAG